LVLPYLKQINESGGRKCSSTIFFLLLAQNAVGIEASKRVNIVAKKKKIISLYYSTRKIIANEAL
jgi:hypothetical protein